MYELHTSTAASFVAVAPWEAFSAAARAVSAAVSVVLSANFFTAPAASAALL